MFGNRSERANRKLLWAEENFGHLKDATMDEFVDYVATTPIKPPLKGDNGGFISGIKPDHLPTRDYSLESTSTPPYVYTDGVQQLDEVYITNDENWLKKNWLLLVGFSVPIFGILLWLLLRKPKRKKSKIK